MLLQFKSSWTLAEVDQLMELYEADKSTEQIAEAIGRSSRDVSKRLRWILHGIPIANPPTQSHEQPPIKKVISKGASFLRMANE